MRSLTAAAVAAALTIAAGPVSAEQIGIGTTGQGSQGYSMGSAVAKVLDAKTKIKAVI